MSGSPPAEDVADDNQVVDELDDGVQPEAEAGKSLTTAFPTPL